MAEGSKQVVLAALGVNLAIAVSKFVAAWISGSSAMLAEACHSLADTANQAFLLLGMRLSQRPPDELHPFGYARERYFWAFIVALCVFLVGALVSIHEGVEKLWHYRTQKGLGSLTLAFVTLGIALVLELYSFLVAKKEFAHVAQGRPYKQVIRESRDPVVMTVLFEDSAALIGLVIALFGLALVKLTGSIVYDGVASVAVGLVLGAVAIFLARKTKMLLIGEAVTRTELEQITQMLAGSPHVRHVIHVRTMHMGPEEVILGLKIDFADALTMATLPGVIDQLEAQLRKGLPKLTRIYIEADSLRLPADAAHAEVAGAKPPGAASGHADEPV